MHLALQDWISAVQQRRYCPVPHARVHFPHLVLSGKPAQAGESQFVVRGTDANGCFAEIPQVMTVDMPVPTMSPWGLLLLAAGKGTPIVVRSEGTDEAEAMTALADLVDRRNGLWSVEAEEYLLAHARPIG